MKKGLFCVIFFASTFILMSCAGTGSVNSSDDDFGFQNKAEQTMAVLSSKATAFSIKTDVAAPAFTNGNVKYEIYKLFSDYNGEGKTIGVQNMYNNINTAESYLSDLQCANDVNKVVTSPYDFGYQTETYECGDNSSTDRIAYMAWTKNETSLKGLIVSTGPVTALTGAESLVMQGNYTSTTNEIVLNTFCYVDYTSEVYTGSNLGKFISRMDLTGNTDTHTFTIKAIDRNPETGGEGLDGYALDMVGKGVSQGAGQFFLLKAKDNGNVVNGGAGPIPMYFCIPASATKDMMEALVGYTDVNDVNLANCAAYRTEVENMTFLDEATVIPENAPTSTLTF